MVDAVWFNARERTREMIKKVPAQVRGIVSAKNPDVDSAIDDLIYRINIALKTLENKVKLIVDNNDVITIVRNAADTNAVISLQHTDTTKPFIKVVGDSAAGLTKNVTTLAAGTVTGHFKVSVNGADRWVAFKTTPS